MICNELIVTLGVIDVNNNKAIAEYGVINLIFLFCDKSVCLWYYSSAWDTFVFYNEGPPVTPTY